MLLGAAATCRESPPDGTTLRAVRDALAPHVGALDRVEVEAGRFRWRGVGLTDPAPRDGLCARLARAGVSAFSLRAPLGVDDLRSLLEWMSALAVSPPRTGGFRFEFHLQPPRSEREIAELVEALARDPASGLDILALTDGPGRTPSADGAERGAGIARKAAETLRQHLGVPRMAAAEAELRRSLAPEALLAAFAPAPQRRTDAPPEWGVLDEDAGASEAF